MIIRKEMKNGLISFLIWTAVLCGMFGMIFLLYPYIIDDVDPESINALLNLFPESVLKAFNMDLSGIDSAFGWLKSEGFVFILLVSGCYSALLGSSIVLKEENDHTIEYLNALPVSRTQIVLKKYISGLIYVTGFVLVTAVSNWLFLTFTETVDNRAYWLLAITPLFTSVVLYSIGMLISTFMHRSRTMMGISLGFVFVSYILNMFSGMSDKTEFLKYFSVFTLADIRNVMVNIEINPMMIIISILISIVSLIGSIAVYQRKELL
ncbi:MAG: ABC transporter permease [Erysipelotrichaceae bacterium]|nr:ABC transporter permease [Erysipelotrichaceae bacterium]